ncbi:unnamed protein product [Anisakis simplex]|uniref:Uncharacterized protein n=1 Tax=Anisakis simplex TaxID=6269 RepID=A0A3P6PJC7_ANISI|nr:unnamed protein product [Anisakis simplex]
MTARYGDFKEECFPRPSGGCSCNIKDAQGRQSVQSFSDDQECKIPIHGWLLTLNNYMIETAIKKQAVNEEIKDKFGAFKENCFPKPSGGCKCNEKIHDKEVVHVYENDEDCRVNAPSSAQKIHQKFGDFKENCFPTPSGGCKCNEVDEDGTQMVAFYDNVTGCKLKLSDSIRGIIIICIHQHSLL